MFKKREIGLIVLILMVAGIMTFFFRIQSGRTGEWVRVVIDGKEYGSYLISQDKTIEIDNTFGYNRIVIENQEVFMEHADCPDQYCVKHKAISKINETIVCLPHRLVIELHGEKNGIEYDSIAQ